MDSLHLYHIFQQLNDNNHISMINTGIQQQEPYLNSNVVLGISSYTSTSATNEVNTVGYYRYSTNANEEPQQNSSFINNRHLDERSLWSEEERAFTHSSLSSTTPDNMQIELQLFSSSPLAVDNHTSSSYFYYDSPLSMDDNAVRSNIIGSTTASMTPSPFFGQEEEQFFHDQEIETLPFIDRNDVIVVPQEQHDDDAFYNGTLFDDIAREQQQQSFIIDHNRHYAPPNNGIESNLDSALPQNNRVGPPLSEDVEVVPQLPLPYEGQEDRGSNNTEFQQQFSMSHARQQELVVPLRPTASTFPPSAAAQINFHSPQVTPPSFSWSSATDTTVSFPSVSDKKMCRMCGTFFGRKRDRQRHENTVHSSDYPYRCDLCGTRFKRPDICKKHRGIRKCLKQARLFNSKR
ncbi:hypothetical protein BDA99DRAFT_532820 [Phascolomyces articulosus]|uniref:C2H2-type domain-containing protein n=1 Tax=Phascolomyces articulosus TaxID=60185 RepID=A0AAD5PIC4_9FUNG|nr:hypothetical protein BDA99DRAFT_532820 [Phascolomyces articulosus]